MIRPVSGDPTHQCGKPTEAGEVLCRQHLRQSKGRARRKKPPRQYAAKVVSFDIPKPGEQKLMRAAEIAEPAEQKWFRQAVRARAHGHCEAKVADVCTGRYAHAHHVVPKDLGQGWELLHDPTINGLGVCWECHAWIHAHPRDAADLGLLRNSWDRPASQKILKRS